MDACDECSYVYDTPRSEIANRLRQLVPHYTRLLEGDDQALREHGSPGVWSSLEYACHVRDVLDVQRTRILSALVEDRPTFASMRREERVTEERYNEQNPRRVATAIAAMAEALAGTLDALDHQGWQRTAVYNYPETQVRNVEWIGRHTLHEAIHHILDIERQLGA